jgi:hypothetical protein
MVDRELNASPQQTIGNGNGAAGLDARHTRRVAAEIARRRVSPDPFGFAADACLCQIHGAVWTPGESLRVV